MSDRASHIAWCKARALAELDAGNAAASVSSMISDMMKHDETRDVVSGPVGTLGLEEALLGAEGVRRWIEGFG